MAPGSGDGWPQIIRPQHSGNARLVRKNGEPSEWLALLARARERLRHFDSGEDDETGRIINDIDEAMKEARRGE